MPNDITPRFKVPAQLEIQLTFPTTNDRNHPKADRSGRYVSMRIMDRASGMLLVEVDLSGVEFTAILASSYTWVEQGGWVGGHLDRVGKTHEHETIHLGHIPALDKGAWQAEVDAAAEPYRADWEVVEGRKHNTGTVLHLSRWIDATPEA